MDKKDKNRGKQMEMYRNRPKQADTEIKHTETDKTIKKGKEQTKKDKK